MFEVNTPLPIDPQRVSDLLCAAFEGGSNHWLQSAVLTKGTAPSQPWYGDAEVFAEGWEAKLTSHEGEDFVLDAEAVNKGLNLMAEQFPSTHFADFMEENEDAETGDVFLQLAVMEEVTYG